MSQSRQYTIFLRSFAIKCLKTGLLSSIFLANSAFAESAHQDLVINSTYYPPYVIEIADKSPSGVSIDILREVFGSMNITVKFRIAPYKRTVRNFLNSSDTLMMGIFEGIPNYKSLDLAEVSYMSFPTTYFYNAKIHPQYAKITRLEQTKGKSVAIMDGTEIYESVISQSGGIVQKLSSQDQVLKMVLFGRTDFAHTGLLTGLDSLNKIANFQDVHALPFHVTEITTGLVFPKGLFPIKDKFYKKIKQFHQNGRMLEIYKASIKNIPLAKAEDLIPPEIGTRINTAVQ